MMSFLVAVATRGQMGAKLLTSAVGSLVAIERELLDAMIQKAAPFISGIPVDDRRLTSSITIAFAFALNTARLRCFGDHPPAIRP
jgi:hypothetical protein